MRIPKGGVGVFDSGIGGLTVLAACQKRLPDTLFYYYGDNARAPYGNLPEAKIRRYVRQAFRVFAKLRVRAVVIACNTATAVCVEELRKKYPFPIIGAEPAVLPAAKLGGECYILSTRATHESPRFRALCQRVALRYPQTKLRPIACDGLAGEIERRLTSGLLDGGKGVDGLDDLADGEMTCLDVRAWLPPGKPNAVVLGCTHYVFIRKQAEAFYGCPVLDGNEGIAARLQSVCVTNSAQSVTDTLEARNGRQKIGHGGKLLRRFQKIRQFFRDGRPPRRDGRPQPTTAPFSGAKKREKPQNHFTKIGKKRQNCKNPPVLGKIFFLGSGSSGNKRLCEQMFVSKK